MKGFLIVIAAAALVVSVHVSSSAQSLDVLQYPSDVAILKCDSYKDPLPESSYCHSCSDNDRPFNDLAACPRSVAREIGYCHPVVTAEREDSNPRFTYQLLIRNESQKSIRAVDWEYTFLDPETQSELARHQFRTEEQVRPGKRKTLVEYSTSPPTRVISVKTLSQPEPDRFIEKVTIRRVTYRDGSVWENLSPSQ